MASSLPRSGGELKGGRKLPKDWLLALFLILGIYLWQRTAFPLWMDDLIHIQLAAHLWQNGETQWMYAPVDHYQEWYQHCENTVKQMGGEGFGNPYFYPPFVAAMLSPFAELSPFTWRNILCAINIALLFVNALLILQVCRVSFNLRYFFWSLSFVLLAFPLARAAHIGQIVPLLAAFWGIGILFATQKKWVAGGLVLGIVSAIKLFPLGLILIPLLARQFKLTAVWFATVLTVYTLSLLTLGMEIHQLWWKALSEFGSLIYSYFGNQSLIGWYSRIFRPKSLTDFIPYTDFGIEIAKNTFGILLGSVTLFVLWKNRNKINSEILVPCFGFLMSAVLLSIANSWEHYWMFVLPVLGWAIHLVWINRDKRFWEIWLVTAAFFFLMKLTRFYTDDTLGRVISGSQTIGMLMLWIWLLRYFWSLKDTRGGESSDSPLSRRGGLSLRNPSGMSDGAGGHS